MFLNLWLCLVTTCFTCTNGNPARQTPETKQSLITTGAKFQGSKDCVVLIKDTQVAEITQLLTMDHVNMIDLRLFTGPNFKESLLPQLELTFVNGVGREFISMLDIKYLIVTWTLNAGRRRFDLHIKESHKGCISKKANKTDFVSGTLIRRFVGNLPPKRREVCYVDKELHANRRCCKMVENDLPKYHCYEDEYQDELLDLLFSLYVTIAIFSLAFIFIFIFSFTSLVQNSSHLTYNRYYNLTESTLSISCIVRHILWSDHGRIVSIIRRGVFMCLVSYLIISHFWPSFLISVKSIHSMSPLVVTVPSVVFFVYWVIFFSFSKLFIVVILSDEEKLRNIQGTPTPYCLSKLIAAAFGYDVQDLRWSYDNEVDGLMSLISLPFNAKRWKEAIKKIHETFTKHISKLWKRISFCNSPRKKAPSFLAYIYIAVFCIPVVFVMIIILILTTMVVYAFRKFRIVHPDSKTVASYFPIPSSIHEVVLLILSIIFTGVISVLVFIPFFKGLFSNIMYFIPYITAITVCTFHFVQYWKKIESKYFALKILIYEEYRDRESKNNGNSTNNNSPSNNSANDDNVNGKKGSGEIVPVVSKQLYHRIREQVLPYHTNLCRHGLGALSILLLSCLLVYLVHILQESDVTRIVKVLQTASVSVLPYVFNALVWKSSEDEQKAWKEEMKVNVKCVVDKLADDPELDKTFLILRPYSYDTTSNKQSESEEGLLPTRKNWQYETAF